MNWKKIGIYIILAFGISWTVALIMKLTNIQYGSLISVIVTGLLFMPGPAISTFIVQKFIYKEGFKQYGWLFDKNFLMPLLLAPVLFLSIVSLTFGTIALLGNTGIISQFGQIDFSQGGFNLRFIEVLKGKVDITHLKIPNIPPLLFFLGALLQGGIFGGIINSPFMFSEEFGWRGLMAKETQKLGFIKANLLIGVVWGIWHFPVILMGHNYPNHPYSGIIMMCLFTTAISPIFAYIRFKTKTILGSCLLHGMINATGQVYALFVANSNDLLGSPAGLAGTIAGVIITFGIIIIVKDFVKQYATLE